MFLIYNISIKEAYELEEIIKLLSQINEKLESQRDDIIYTREEAKKHYKLSQREVDKIYNTILKDKVVDIGKCQRLAKVHIDDMFKNGIKMKHV